ncbi:hypothetical protein BCV70DRAFT_7239 [Testicularia cyperi]|uniref:Uncharacterized protein n=1 Tax=Testicularia cyperi TaxID=1882483 RepID=A0A317XX60_9BASI|nr:hypothetical protein BCV70DRAFT_7239 [Testicularia cyperi]
MGRQLHAAKSSQRGILSCRSLASRTASIGRAAATFGACAIQCSYAECFRRSAQVSERSRYICTSVCNASEHLLASTTLSYIPSQCTWRPDGLSRCCLATKATIHRTTIRAYRLSRLMLAYQGYVLRAGDAFLVEVQGAYRLASSCCLRYGGSNRNNEISTPAPAPVFAFHIGRESCSDPYES